MNIIVSSKAIKELLELIEEISYRLPLKIRKSMHKLKNTFEESAKECKSYDGYSWIKVPKYEMDESKSWEERYKELEKHHIQECTFLIDELRNLGK